MPRISGLRFEIEQNGETFTYDSGELPGLTNGVADRLDLVLQLSGKTGETIVIPAPVVIEYDDAHFWNFEEANVVFASPEAVNPAELVDLLDNACFSSSDDREADSWDTQHDRFLLDAQEMATRLLLGDEAALLERLRAILAYRTQWFVPEGAQFVAVIGRETMDVRMEQVPAA